jgi:hypothetical protein
MTGPPSEREHDPSTELKTDDVVSAQNPPAAIEKEEVAPDIISNAKRTPEYRLYKDRRLKEGADADEPPILWTATVYEANTNVFGIGALRKGGPGLSAPAAVYYDDQPLKMSFRETQKDQQPLDHASDGKKDDSSRSHHPIWTGCVFAVTCWAAAGFPLLVSPNQDLNKDLKKDPKKDRKKDVRKSAGLALPLPPAPAPLASDLDVLLGLGKARNYHLVTSKYDSLEFEKASRSNILIKSPYIYEKLKDFAEYYPSFFMGRHTNAFHKYPTGPYNGGFEISDPWGILFHRFPEIEAFVQSETAKCETQDAEKDWKLKLQREHVSHLYQFLKPLYNSRILPCRKALEQPAPELPFDMLWYAFAPGTDVYIQDGEPVLACVVTRIMNNLDEDYESADRIAVEPEYWVLELWYLDTDGEEIGRVPTTRKIYAYSGSQQLTSLEVCPANIWDAFDHGERRKRIMRRSKILEKYFQQGHLLALHEGPTSGADRYVSDKPFI